MVSDELGEDSRAREALAVLKDHGEHVRRAALEPCSTCVSINIMKYLCVQCVVCSSCEEQVHEQTRGLQSGTGQMHSRHPHGY